MMAFGPSTLCGLCPARSGQVISEIAHAGDARRKPLLRVLRTRGPKQRRATALLADSGFTPGLAGPGTSAAAVLHARHGIASREGLRITRPRRFKGVESRDAAPVGQCLGGAACMHSVLPCAHCRVRTDRELCQVSIFVRFRGQAQSGRASNPLTATHS